VVRGGGAPLPGALVYVFHADARGRYTPGRALDEPHARLFAYLRTDSAGRYTLRTVRPGPYPAPIRVGAEKRRIPEHVHFVITAPGYRPRTSQMYFADDPLMKPDWARENARRHAFPVVAVARDPGGVLRCRCDWDLTPE
jgi:catechol 1,2-dioxygenase